MMRRRELLAGAGSLLGLPAFSQAPAKPARVKLAVSTYSYWHFRPPRFPIEQVIEDAARIGFEGVEILHRQMTDESVAYMNKLKMLALRNGLSLPMLSIHQDFVSPAAEERKKHIDHTKRCIGLAAQMGIPAIRLNSGRWKTVKSFDELMKVKGDEPPLPGYTLEDAFKWCIDSINECLPAAEKAGVLLALENHWGLTTRVENLLRIWKGVNSPWLGINLDTGNYPGDAYDGVASLAPYANIVQAKTYYGGWVSLEMEGKELAATAVPKSYAVLKEAFG